jgi:hypothetical protein
VPSKKNRDAPNAPTSLHASLDDISEGEQLPFWHKILDVIRALRTAPERSAFFSERKECSFQYRRILLAEIANGKQPPATLPFLTGSEGRWRNTMSIVEFAIVLQNIDGEANASNPRSAEYFVIALVAVLLGVFVLVFVRTSARGSSKR